MHALAVVLALWSLAVNAETVTGVVTRIADGDTLTLVDATSRQHTIRLADIDAPEIGQDFGQQSRTRLSALAFNQQALAQCTVREAKRPAVCLVTVSGKDIGLEQLRGGMAWYQQEGTQQTASERAGYEQAEFNAKIRRFGLWNSKNPTPPWEWRHGLPAE